jgi:hypothetical protein
VREQQELVDNLQREWDQYQQEQVIRDRIAALEAQKEAQEAIVDGIKAQQDAIQEFTSDIGLLDDEVQKNISSWEQLIAALQAAGIAYGDITPYVTPIAGTPTGGAATSNELLASQTSGTIKKGSTGENVKAIQRALLALGYYAGEISGTFDTATHNATVQFQIAAGLIKSASSKNAGVIGSKTRSAFAAKGFEKGGIADYTGLAYMHGSPIRPEYVQSAPAVESMMSSLPAILAQMANGGGGITFTGDIAVSANNPYDFLRQMKNFASLNTLVGRR